MTLYLETHPRAPREAAGTPCNPEGRPLAGADSMQDVRRRHPAPNYVPAPRTLPPGREKGIPWTHTPSPACTSHTSDATTAQQSASCSTVARKEPGPRPPQGSRCRTEGRETRGQCGQAPPTTVTPVSCRPRAEKLRCGDGGQAVPLPNPCAPRTTARGGPGASSRSRRAAARLPSACLWSISSSWTRPSASASSSCHLL